MGILLSGSSQGVKVNAANIQQPSSCQEPGGGARGRAIGGRGPATRSVAVRFILLMIKPLHDLLYQNLSKSWYIMVY